MNSITGVASGLDGLGDSAVGAVCADHYFHGQRLARVVLGVEHDVGRVGGGRDLEAADEAGDEAGVAEEGVEYFAAAHGDEFVGLESFAEIDGEIRGVEDPHAGDVAIDEAGGNVELVIMQRGLEDFEALILMVRKRGFVWRGAENRPPKMAACIAEVTVAAFKFFSKPKKCSGSGLMAWRLTGNPHWVETFLNANLKLRLCLRRNMVASSSASSVSPPFHFKFDYYVLLVVYVKVDEEVLRTSSQYNGLEDFEHIDVQVGDAIKVLEKLSPLANEHHLGSLAAHRVYDCSGVDGHSDIDIKLDVIMDDLGSRIGGYIECGAGQVVDCYRFVKWLEDTTVTSNHENIKGIILVSVPIVILGPLVVEGHRRLFGYAPLFFNKGVNLLGIVMAIVSEL
ncbi:hypothetical protein M0R45_035748 [Rubus argutus]|uniref:Uncharacterized protein n=1 Tax=Rubus argutus TaxID=59490 RepID=A0AAW1VV50_RUBAR